MPLYVFRCPDGHLVEEVRQMGDKFATRCHEGRIAQYDFGSTLRPTVKVDCYMGTREQEAISVQTGKRFTNTREFAAWARKTGNEPYQTHYGNPAEKAKKEELKALQEKTSSDCKNIWRDTMREKY